MLKVTRTALLVLFCGTSGLHARSGFSKADLGTIQIVIKDENAAPVAKAPVYIVHGHRMDYAESDARGVVTVGLTEGTYTISSALTRPQADCVDRYASPEAPVWIAARSHSSLILNLHPVEGPVAHLSKCAPGKIAALSFVKTLN